MTLAAWRHKLEQYLEPIVVLEWRRFRRSRDFTGLIVICALLLLVPAALIYARSDAAAQVTLAILAMFYALAAVAFIPSHGGRAIQREKETGSWDLLVLTPMQGSTVADQKVFAVALPTLILLVAGLPAVVTAAAISGLPVLQVLAVVPMVVLVALGSSYWSVQASCECGKAALTIAYAPLISYLCGYLICGGYIVALALLFNPQLRGQAGRILLSHFFYGVVFGAATLAIMNAFRVFEEDGIYIAPLLAAVAAYLLQILGLIFMRRIMIWGVSSLRRAA